jgi:hypothetical protein
LVWLSLLALIPVLGAVGFLLRNKLLRDWSREMEVIDRQPMPHAPTIMPTPVTSLDYDWTALDTPVSPESPGDPSAKHVLNR